MGSAGIAAHKCGLLILALLAAFALIIVLVVLVVPKSSAGPSKSYQALEPDNLISLDKAPALDLKALQAFYSADLRVLVKFAGYIEYPPKENAKFENLSVVEVQHQENGGLHVIDLHTDTYKIRLVVERTRDEKNGSRGDGYYVNDIQLFQRVAPRADRLEKFCTAFVGNTSIVFGKGNHYCCYESNSYFCMYEQLIVARSNVESFQLPTLRVAALEFEIDGYAEGQEPGVFTKPRKWCKPTVKPIKWNHV